MLDKPKHMTFITHWVSGALNTSVLPLVPSKRNHALEQQSPTFWHKELVSWKTIFPQMGVEDGGWGGELFRR